ncbi:MAG: DUF502 domain-containing protein [Campylobacteraceae bacterium]|nr:DUF502 domain-containing protein [Campylobacteraceae bacterium]
MLNKIKEYFSGGWTHFLKVTVQGIFWLTPIVAIIAVVLWLYGKADFITAKLFHLIGLNPQHNIFLWTVAGVALLAITAYAIGHFIETRLGGFVEKLLSRVPGYMMIKDLVGIFNSSKKGEKQVLVVMIRGFANQGYNIGLMYSQTQGILKEHYTVTLSQTPIPNGGYMFEVHQDEIYIIEEATFDNNLQYLLSMGVKSLGDIINTQPKNIEELITLTTWLENKALSE